MAIQSPKSLTRLQITACRAEVLASLRPGHHEIRRNDRILTLSHLTSRKIRLVHEVRQNMKVMNSTIKNVNFLTLGSSTMQLAVKRMIDHKTKYPNMKKEILQKSSEKIYLFISHPVPISRVQLLDLGKVAILNPAIALTSEAYRRNWTTPVFFIISIPNGRLAMSTTLKST